MPGCLLYTSLLDRKHTLQTRWYGHMYTLLVVIFGFVLFRAESLPQALMLLRKMCIRGRRESLGRKLDVANLTREEISTPAKIAALLE